MRWRSVARGVSRRGPLVMLNFEAEISSSAQANDHPELIWRSCSWCGRRSRINYWQAIRPNPLVHIKRQDDRGQSCLFLFRFRLRMSLKIVTFRRSFFREYDWRLLLLVPPLRRKDSHLTPMLKRSQVAKFGLVTASVAVMEAVSEQNDNLMLPIWGWCVGVLLEV